MSDPEDVVLCVNTGSSSLKLAVFAVGAAGARAVAAGGVERIGLGGGRVRLQGPGGILERSTEARDHAAALATGLSLLTEVSAPQPTVAGHRVVHGGPLYAEPARVDEGLLAALRGVVPMAPLHLPASIAAMEAIARLYPQVPQVACFDTAFHATMPDVARRFPLPDRFYERGVRRYGFHGLSYEYVLSTLGPAPPARLVIAHLGNGASLVAVRDGRSIDTTMGLTPAGGIPMGTRTGDIDPGVLLYLGREEGLSADALEALVDREAGLLAVGGTSDMKTLLGRAATDDRARRAVSMFGYAVRKAIGAFVAALGGIDLLVFTGGIGEHAPEVREEACRGLEAMGIVLDRERNARGEDVVSAPSSPCPIRVVATDEDAVIARHARRVVRGA